MADLCLERLELPWLLGGLLDEPAHLATAALVSANLPARSATWGAGCGAGAVAVDADHLPLVRIRHTISKDTPRPAAHTLLLPAGLAAAASVSRTRAREALIGAATGTCIHFLRDLATGSGLAPLKPLASWRLKAPPEAYRMAMVLLTARAWRLSR